MKIATITCHDVYNYGASLQAYALQTFCQSLGHDYQIIDYKPSYLSNHYKLDAVCNPRFDKPIIKQAYLLAKLPERIRNLKRKRLFDRFTSKYLCLTQQRYVSCDDISTDCPDSDLFIAGSDQIWNTLFKNGQDPAFYLDFVGNRGRKISYAASFATDRIYNGAERFVATKLKNFDAISVRESSALSILKALNCEKGILVADPVFLLSKVQWLKLASEKKKPTEKYILVYDCEQSQRLRDIAIELRRRTGLKIYTVSPTFGKYANRNFELSGPIEFIHLINNSQYVVANSFHALAFALIFNKNFFIINRSEGINTRMCDFLHFLGLDSRLINSASDLTCESINYVSIEPKINSLIKISTNFLEQQIECLSHE